LRKQCFWGATYLSNQGVPIITPKNIFSVFCISATLNKNAQHEQAGRVALIIDDKKSSITIIRNAAFFYFVFLAFVVAVLVLVVAVSLVLAFLVDSGLSINFRQSS
jgi:hypothetical protein